MCVKNAVWYCVKTKFVEEIIFVVEFVLINVQK